MSENDPNRFAPPGQEPASAPPPPPAAPGEAGDVPADPPTGPTSPPPGPGATTPPAAPPPGALTSVTPTGSGHPAIGTPLSEEAGWAPPAPGSAAPARSRPRRARGALLVAIALIAGLIGGYGGSEIHDRISGEETAEPTATITTDPGRVDPAPLPGENDDVSKVAETLLPSTVQIFAEVDGVQNAATGSGFVLDNQGRIVTNNHVIAGSATDNGEITVLDHAGTEHDATLVGRSETFDLAVIRVQGDAALTPAALGTSSDLQIGESVIAFGSPLGLTSSVTVGIVSALHRPVSTGDAGDSRSYIDAVQTDAAINPGNSGGPLVNLQGQVIGVNSAIATAGSGQAGNIGVGFAIPIDQVKTTSTQLIEDGRATYAILGADVAMRPSTNGARISEVENGSPAATAGLRSGDRVTHVDDQRITDGVALIVAVRARRPGDEVELTVDRAGRERTVKVTLGAQQE